MAIDISQTPAIEATSLSSVLELAANPPAHPTTSIPPGTAPLTLYIARVPGSQDVFLTPIKPREKVVTAADVQSSLYYVHVHCANDCDAVERLSSVNADVRQLPAVQRMSRKAAPPPLPRRPAERARLAPYPVDDGMPRLPGRSTSPQKIARKQVLSDITNGSPTRRSEDEKVNLPNLPPRPLPTPPAESEPMNQSLHEDNIRLLRRESHTDGWTNPYDRLYQALPHLDNEQQQDEPSPPEPGSLTLIRRDPGSTRQWNVASIHDPPVHEVSSSALLVPTASRRTKRGGAPLYLDITNPSYAQFASRPESRSSTSATSSDSGAAPDRSFRRRLYMPGSRYAEHGYVAQGHRKQLSVSSASSFSSGGDVRKTMRADPRHHSIDFGALGPPKVDWRSKGYSFSSPWEGGTCDFTTGATGKSLKCRHHLPSDGGKDGEVVSELRFNLPTSSSNGDTSTPVSEKRSSYFTHHRHNSSFSGSDSPTIIINDDGRIDLSLGQERAGGGFGGKQAKLGKLIIEPHGFEMLDLLVAANVGLWWRAWTGTR